MPDIVPAAATEAAWQAWYADTYGADYPNGTEFDSGEMYEAFAAGWDRAMAAVRERIMRTSMSPKPGDTHFEALVPVDLLAAAAVMADDARQDYDQYGRPVIDDD